MKLGTESKKKTIVACVLGGLAVILAANWLLNSGPSSQAAAPAKPAPVVSADTLQDTSKPKKQNTRRDEKMLAGPVFKPSLDPSLNLKMLEDSERIEYKGNGRNIFDMTTQPRAEDIKIPQPGGSGRTDAANTPLPPQPKPGPPPPPPINLKFYGFSTRGGQKTVFLAQSPESVFVAHEGDIIARRYKVVHINPNSVEIQDLLSNNKQTITLSAS